MTIEATCDSCFRTYQVKDALAGRKVRCKECGEVVRIPRPGAARSPAAVDPWDDDDDPYVDDSSSALPPRRSTGQRKKRRKKKAGSDSGMSFGVIGILGAVCGVLFLMTCVVGFVLPLAWVMLMIGMFVVGAGVSIVGAIGLLMAAFEEDTICGVMYLLVPFYSFYYIITRFGEVWKLFLMNLGGVLLMVAASAVGALLDAAV